MFPSGTITAYTYDVENRLVAKNNGVRLGYDPLGRLFEITDANGNIRRHVYDGDELIAEYDANNVLLRRYVHGGGAQPANYLTVIAHRRSRVWIVVGRRHHRSVS